MIKTSTQILLAYVPPKFYTSSHPSPVRSMSHNSTPTEPLSLTHEPPSVLKASILAALILQAIRILQFADQTRYSILWTDSSRQR